MAFIMLTDTSGKKVSVNVASISMIYIDHETQTGIRFADGYRLFVKEDVEKVHALIARASKAS